MIGRVLEGKYEIVSLLGEGGMGAVYEARDDKGAKVAVKVIAADQVGNDMLVTRFEREALAAAKVRSPHVVDILGAGRDGDRPFMVMELLAGVSLHQLLRQLGPLAPELALRIGVQVCAGLEAAHDQGILHRDIKPGNLFLCDGGDEYRVKLLDFGVAKFKMDRAAEDGAESLTRTGSMLGSPLYMSPEQARGLKNIDHRADLWSLGIVMYQMLTGKPPLSGKDGLGEIIIAVCSEEPDPVSTRAPWVSRRIERAVHGALKLAADERYASARQMRGALLACLADASDVAVRKAMLAPLDEAARAARSGDDDDDGQDRTTIALDGSGSPISAMIRSAIDQDDLAPARSAEAAAPSVSASSSPKPEVGSPKPASPQGEPTALPRAIQSTRPPKRASSSRSVVMALAAIVTGLLIGAAVIFAMTRGQSHRGQAVEQPAPAKR